MERKKVRDLFRFVADFIEPEELTDPPEEIIIAEPDQDFIPDDAVTLSLPIILVTDIETVLGVRIDRNDATFYFDNEKFQILKFIDQRELPTMNRPLAAMRVSSALQHMSNLLGVPANVNYDDNSLKFIQDNEVFKIIYIYTGDHFK